MSPVPWTGVSSWRRRIASISGPIPDWLRYRVGANAGGQGEGFFEDVNSNETEGEVTAVVDVPLLSPGQQRFEFGYENAVIARHPSASRALSRACAVAASPSTVVRMSGEALAALV